MTACSPDTAGLEQLLSTFARVGRESVWTGEAVIDIIRKQIERCAAQSQSGKPIETCLEVWNGDRKVTVYEDIVLRVWGSDIETEMSKAKRSHETVDEAFRWLYAICASKAVSSTDGN